MMDRNLWQEGRKDGGFLAGTITSGVFGGLFGLLQAWLLALVIVRAYTGRFALQALKWPLAALLGIILVRAACNWLEEFFALRLAGGVQQRLRKAVLEKIARLGPVRMRQKKQGELQTLLTEGLDTLEVYFQKYLPQLFKSAILPVVFLIIVFPLDWITGLIMIITAPLVPVFMWLIGSWTKQQTKKQWRVLAAMGGYFQDTLEGLSTLKLFNRTAGQREKIDDVSDEFRRVNLRVLKWAFLSALVLELLTTISIALIAVGLGLRLVNGLLDFQTALFLLFLAPDFYLPLRSLGTQYHNSLNGAEAARDIYAFLDEPEEEAAPEDAAAPANGSALAFQNVSFAYRQGRQALQSVSFSLAPGEKLGIVGPSGSGKTTILQLISGFLQPGSGTIWVQGESLAQMDGNALRRHIAMVPQNPYLFRGTILENIRMGNEQASDEAIESLCRKIGAHAFITGLPAGYGTPVGQGGYGLSGGEVQLVAIARACLKDAPVILLDEATKNLDWNKDHMVQQALRHLTKDKTVVAVAHRLQTITDMDKVLVLENGSVAEWGTPEELRHKQGLFAGLVTKTGRSIEVSSAPAETKAQQASNGFAAAKQLHSDHPAGQPDASEKPSPPQQPPKTRGALRTMLGLSASYKGVMTGASLLGASSIAANIALLGFSALLITKASYMPPILDLMTVIVAVRFFGISRAILRYGERYISHDATFRILKKLRLWYYDQMEKLSYTSLQKLGMGRVFKHIIGDVDVLKFFYLRVMMVPMVAAVILLGCGIFLGFYSPTLVVLLVAFFAVGGLVAPWLYQRLFARRRGDYDQIKQLYNEELYDYIGGLTDEEVFGATEKKRQSIVNSGAEMIEERRAIGAWDGFAQVLCALLANLALFSALLVLVPAIHTGQMSGLVLAPLVWVVWAAFEALQPVTAAAEYLNQSRQALQGMEEAAARPREPARTGSKELPRGQGLSIQHLAFGYEAGSRVLQDVSFTLAPGSKTALVGNSGAGKTTLLNLLIGFLPYSQGSIRSGPVELSEVSNKNLRSNIGYLGQHPYLFHDSIRSNILLAKEGAGEEEMRRAAKLAQLDDFVMQLPDGYDTMVGENGYRLSAGQRQRIALARLFLQDAPIIVLDEPTQSLDNENRNALLAALESWWPGKTVLYITHDLYGLGGMDQILLLENGEIAEAGTQAELLQENGGYARLYALQADFFRE